MKMPWTKKQTEAVAPTDAQGSDIDPDIKLGAALDFGVVGETGLRHYGGFVHEEWNPELKGERGKRVYQQMADNDATCGAVVFAFTSLFRSVEWHVEAAKADPSKPRAQVKKFGGRPLPEMGAPPPSDPTIGFDDPRTSVDPNAEPEEPEPPSEEELAAQFVEEVLDDMELPFDGMMEEIASMFVYGFAPCEILYKRRMGPDETDPTRYSKFDDGKIGLRGLPLRAQNTVYRWEIDQATGFIKGMWQQPWSGQQVFIPSAKMALFRTTAAKNNPEGRSILRNAYRPWVMKTRLEEIEAIGVERDLAGIPVARIPLQYMADDAAPQDKAIFRTFQKLVRSIKRDRNEGVVLPSNVGKDGKPLFDLELLSSGGSRQIDTTKIIDRYERQIATSVLADFIFLGQGNTGSFALSADKTDLFAQALTGFLKSVAGVFNRTVIPALWKLNKLPAETMPRLVPGDVTKANLGEIASFLTSLSGAGAPMFPDTELENHLRKLANLPPAPEPGSDERTVPGQEAGAMPPGMEPGADDAMEWGA